jgi:hypothetical protein
MVCEWYDGEGNAVEGRLLFNPATEANPYYPKVLCGAPAINLSARTPHECEASGLSTADCPGVATGVVCTDDADFGQL